MEESANEKIQGNQKVESEEEVKREVVNFVEEEDLQPVVFPSKDIGVVENSESAKENLGNVETNLDEEIGGVNEGLENSGATEDEENKNEASGDTHKHSEVLVDEAASSVENSKDSEVSVVEGQEIKERVSSLIEIDGIAPNVKDTVVNGAEETIKPQSFDESVPQVVTSGIDEIKSPPSEEKNDPSPISVDVVDEEIKEKESPSLDDNCEPSPSITDAVSKETEEKLEPSVDENVAVSSVRSSGIEEEKQLHSIGNVEDSSGPVTNVPAIGSNDGFPDSGGNTPIISLSQRTVQRTSWKSCCGLFEVLRRTDR